MSIEIISKMVEVFKTNIAKQKQSKQVLEKLNQLFPQYKINFDLEDCDNILRIENPIDQVDNDLIIKLIGEVGFCIEPLTEELSVDVQTSKAIT